MTTTQEDLKKEIIDELYWDGRIDAADVQVRVEDNTVELSGTVPSFMARQAAYEDARTVPGVRFVKDDLHVNYPGTLPRPSDSEVESNARLVLDWSPELKIDDREVSVQDGYLTLSGTVDALWKKTHAEKLLLDLPGVLQVENKLAVVPSKDHVAQDIAEDIIRAFDRHALLVNNELDVQVHDGHVALTGEVPNWVVRRAADEIAHYTPGVVSVTNDIQITE